MARWRRRARYGRWLRLPASLWNAVSLDPAVHIAFQPAPSSGYSAGDELARTPGSNGPQKMLPREEKSSEWLDLEMMLVYSLPMPTNLVGKMVNWLGGMLS
jgi:hypothetical protein